MRILFLEDEPTIREVLAEYMKLQDYEVVCAQDGEAALSLLNDFSFDMAVLDIMVPKISGLEVLSYIKENAPQTATVMLTALEDERTQIQAFDLYADDYVIKPVSPIILLKRMETILRRGIGICAAVCGPDQIWRRKRGFPYTGIPIRPFTTGSLFP